MTGKPSVRNLSATPEEVTKAEAFYEKHKEAIVQRALLCEDPAVELHGAWLGHSQSKNHGAASWFVHTAAVYKDFYGEDDDAQ